MSLRNPAWFVRGGGCLGGRVEPSALIGKSLGSSCSLNTTRVQRTGNHRAAVLKSALKFLLSI